MIEFTFQVAMRMPHNLPGGYDNESPCPPDAPALGAADVADAPGASRRCSEPPREPIWWS